jgi:hypothetical protein
MGTRPKAGIVPRGTKSHLDQNGSSPESERVRISLKSDPIFAEKCKSFALIGTFSYLLNCIAHFSLNPLLRNGLTNLRPTPDKTISTALRRSPQCKPLASN